MKPIYLNSESFQYPSDLERDNVINLIPELNNIDIKYKSTIEYLVDGSDIEKAKYYEDIFWWTRCFQNRLNKVFDTYVYLKVHYNRFINLNNYDDNNKHTEEHLLKYYIEIYFYFYYSARDISGQLINHLEQITKNESGVFINDKFIEEIKNSELKNVFNLFYKSTYQQYKNYRNAYNHRYTPDKFDNRAINTVRENENVYSFIMDTENKLFYDNLIEECDNLFKHLNNFVGDIDPLIQKYFN